VRLKVLNVAYPFAPVGPDTAGGAEQILLTLDRALVAAGHVSHVMAEEGSQLAGNLIAMPRADVIDTRAKQRVHAAYAAALRQEAAKADVIHMHGVDFDAYLPPPGPPVLVTLHLPISWYADLRPKRPRTFLHCVSASQHREAAGVNLLPPIENGIDIEAFAGQEQKRGFALMLSRICPEKGVHLALDAARLAGIPLIIAGQVFRYAEHRDYFETEIVPRLDGARRYLGPVGPAHKRRLLKAACCVLIASTVPETSSLAAREALAAGTPVIAFRRGALIDTIEEGTGFLVDDVAEMAAAIGRTREIDPQTCRALARRRFSDRDMIARYLDLYQRLACCDAPQFGDAA